MTCDCDCDCKPKYPHPDGDYTVIGPECFTDGEVISYKGENFVRQEVVKSGIFLNLFDRHWVASILKRNT